MTNRNLGPEEDENSPEEWAANGPEPNTPTDSPLRGVVPAGAMSEDGPNPTVSPELLAAQESVLAASAARQAENLADLMKSQAVMARGEAMRIRALHKIHAEAEVAAASWVPVNAKGYDVERSAQTEASAEVAPRMRISQPAASALICEANMLLTELPRTFEAIESGDISYHHARRIMSHAGSLPPDSRGPFEDLAVPITIEKTVKQAEPKLKDIRERMHPESIVERHKAAVEDRTVYLTGCPDGMVELTAFLPAEVGVSAFGRISAAAEALKGKDEPRTKPQRMADVFTDLILKSTTAATRGIVPTVLVTVPVRTAAGLGDEPGNLSGYGVISPEVARDLFEKAPSFRRVLVDEDTGELLNLGRTRYRPTAAQRVAVELAHPTCEGIGCAKRADQCEIDHTDPYNEGDGLGTTDFPNLHVLCAKDHRDKHNTRIKVASIEGNLVWTLPSGLQIVTEPEMLVHDEPVKLRVTQAPEELDGVDFFDHSVNADHSEPDDTEPEGWDRYTPSPF